MPNEPFDFLGGCGGRGGEGPEEAIVDARL